MGVSILADQRLLFDLRQNPDHQQHTGVSATPMMDPKMSDRPSLERRCSCPHIRHRHPAAPWWMRCQQVMTANRSGAAAP
jgi:hypothetical protein